MKSRIGGRGGRRRLCSSWRFFVALIVALIGSLVPAQATQAQGMVTPVRMAQRMPGQVLVTDYVARKIHFVETPSIRILWSADIDGRPMGIACLGNLIFVGNGDRQTVEVYELDSDKQKLKLVYHLGEVPRGKQGLGSLKRPTDIAVDPESGLVFVLDIGDQLVKVFGATGNSIGSFPPAVTGQQVTFVAAIAVDSARREVLVTDHGIPYGSFGGPAIAARILFFNLTGSYLRQISGAGYVPTSGTIDDTRFSRPQGLATDQAGHIFMVDAVLGELFVFDQNDVVGPANVAVINRLGGGGQLRGPTDAVLDAASGDIFVVNSKLSRIEVFRAAGRIP